MRCCCSAESAAGVALGLFFGLGIAFNVVQLYLHAQRAGNLTALAANSSLATFSSAASFTASLASLFLASYSPSAANASSDLSRGDVGNTTDKLAQDSPLNAPSAAAPASSFFSSLALSSSSWSSRLPSYFFPQPLPLTPSLDDASSPPITLPLKLEGPGRDVGMLQLTALAVRHVPPARRNTSRFHYLLHYLDLERAAGPREGARQLLSTMEEMVRAPDPPPRARAVLTSALHGHAMTPKRHPAAASPHRLAVLVPYRGAQRELKLFVPRLSAYLAAQKINFTIFVIEQCDEHHFNRGALLNVGFLEAGDSYDYFALHDVDLVPNVPGFSYAFPAGDPVHLTPPNIHPKYHFRKYVGGAMLISRRQYAAVNGMSNIFWGWGKEDVEFVQRFTAARLRLERVKIPPKKREQDPYFQHLHGADRKREKKGRRRLPNTRKFGLNTTEHAYFLFDRRTFRQDGYPFVRISVNLFCLFVPPAVCGGRSRRLTGSSCRNVPVFQLDAAARTSKPGSSAKVRAPITSSAEEAPPEEEVPPTDEDGVEGSEEDVVAEDTEGWGDPPSDDARSRSAAAQQPLQKEMQEQQYEQPQLPELERQLELQQQQQMQQQQQKQQPQRRRRRQQHQRKAATRRPAERREGPRGGARRPASRRRRGRAAATGA